MITKDKLQKNVEETILDTATALMTVFEALNQGQQKKLMKNDKVRELFHRYGIDDD